MAITVTLARKGDEEKIASLLIAIHAQHAEGRPDLFGKGHAKFSADEVLALFDRTDAPVFVAREENGGVIGYAIAMIKHNRNPAQGAYDTFYIDDLNVDAAARRRGVGTALLDACRAYAKEKGCYNVTLNVWAFNEGAIRFYEKNGFAPQRIILETTV